MGPYTDLMIILKDSSFDNMKSSIFYAFDLKTPIHAPKISVLGAFDPLNGERCHRHPQKALPWADYTSYDL